MEEKINTDNYNRTTAVTKYCDICKKKLIGSYYIRINRGILLLICNDCIILYSIKGE